jgi:hypothetical protein
MPIQNPPNLKEIRAVIEERLAAVENTRGVKETVTVEWRGSQLAVPVISMPVNLLHYNPDTHRIRAQRSADSAREQVLKDDPYNPAAQRYLHDLLMGDPADPMKTDPSFVALKEDLQEYGQNDPGIITRAGVLINGNTRRAALKELGQENMRVGVLPPDAGHADLESIELSLQLRKDHRREYSFMNFLLAVDERAADGQPAAVIQSAFRMKATTYERSRWILSLIRDAIKRSEVAVDKGQPVALRLVDFEAHQGKLEELYRAYCALRLKSPDEAEALREQRLLALILEKSKTDLRLIEPDFVKRYMPSHMPRPAAAPSQKIPGTSITVPGPSQEVQALRELTTTALQARSVKRAPVSTPQDITTATNLLGELDKSLVKALDNAGKQARVQKRRIAAADRVSDASDDLALAVQSIAEARATGNFVEEDLEEALQNLRVMLDKLAAIVVRDADSKSEVFDWLRSLGKPTNRAG